MNAVRRRARAWSSRRIRITTFHYKADSQDA